MGLPATGRGCGNVVGAVIREQQPLWRDATVCFDMRIDRRIWLDQLQPPRHIFTIKAVENG